MYKQATVALHPIRISWEILSWYVILIREPIFPETIKFEEIFD
jgi:hypothetical protein